MSIDSVSLSPIVIPARPSFGSLEEEVDWLRARHDTLEYENADLRIEKALLYNQLYGSKSEKSRARDEEEGQQRLFDSPVVDDTAGSDADAPPAAEVPEEKRKRGEAQKRTHGRKPVNKELACIERVHGADGQRFDCDGNKLVITGWNVSERLHHIPNQVVRLIDRYAIWGHPNTRETVEVTPAMPSVVHRGKLTDDFLIEVSIRKYLYSQPLYRQLIDYNGLGAELAESTLSNAVKAMAVFLKPIQEAIEQQVLAQPVMAIDETTMKQQDDKHGKVIRYLWGWLAHRQVSYHYGGRSTEEIEAVLSRQPPDKLLPPQQYAITDGLAAYDKPLAAVGIIHAGCWAHIRREFKPLAPYFAHAKEVFHLINGLYRIERAISKHIEKHHLLGQEADSYRQSIRVAKAQPQLDLLATAIEKYKHLYLPETKMREAFNKMANQFHKLREYAKTGIVPIDNNAVERGMRRVAVGRKNYLFVGSEDAGDWCATMYSIVESCRMCDLNLREYLTTVVAELHQGTPADDLTPLRMRKKILKATPVD